MPRKSPPTTELRAAGASTEEIRLVRARRPFSWLRPVLLVLGIATIGGVLLLLAAYRFGRAEPVEDAARTPASSDHFLTGQGFDFTQSSAGTPVFRIRAAESQQDRNGTSFLTTVDLDVYREDGRTYTITSERARFNESSREARLEGDVVLSGWDRLELRARALELRNKGQVLTSTGAVEFRYPPELVGRASQLQVDRRNDTIILSGGVHLHSVEGAARPMRLDCQRLIFQREDGVLRAVGDASLKTESQSLAAHFLTLFLAEDGRTLEAMRARWNVVGTMTQPDELGGETEIEYRGQFLDVQPDERADEADARRFKLDGEGKIVTLTMTDLTGLRRVFSGLYLVGRARDDRLVQVEGVGEPLVLSESLALPEPFPLRRLCAERMTVRFLPDGGVSRIQLEKRVEMDDRELSLTGGESASLNAENGTFRIQGPAVLLSSRRGEVRAEQFVWTRENGVIRAQSGVRALLAESSVRTLRGTPLGQDEGPVQIEAAEAYWTAEPPTFAFEGEVRAWRGQSLLLAEQLRGDEREEKLAASGGVRTVWVPAASGELQPEPIEVRAQRMTYLEEGPRLVYDDGVEVRQGQRTLECGQLSVELTDGGHAERMTCVTEVRLNDPVSGNRVQKGDRAVYTLADELVEIFGDDVELLDGENNRMRGRYVRYDLRSGTFNIRSRAPEDGGAGSR